MPFTWSPEALDDLHRLYVRQNLTARETAQALGDGLTRNAVLGKAQRMGWAKPAPDKGGRPAKAAKVAKPDRPSRLRPATCVTHHPTKFRRAVPLPLLREITVISTPRLWSEREDRECAFPVGEPLKPTLQLSCCARTAPRRAYCPAHWALMTLGCVALEPAEQKVVADIARRAA